jgi:hypothetical protein
MTTWHHKPEDPNQKQINYSFMFLISTKQSIEVSANQ